jgi:hypothetical protein
MRQVGGQAAYLSQDMLDLHFGLGGFEQADVEITWPEGDTSSISSVPADSVLRVDRPESGSVVAN